MEHKLSASGYLIEKYTDMGSACTCRRLADEAQAAGMDLAVIGVHDTMVTKRGLVSCGKIVPARDFVINRYKWGRLRDALYTLAPRTYNRPDAFSAYVNKFEQMRRLHSDAFLMPAWVLGTSLLPFEEIVGETGIPFVAKGLESSMGEEILLIENEADYARLLKHYGPAKEWLFEEMIRTSIGRDMRLYSIRGSVTAAMVRMSADDFRANVALGARTQPLDITPGLRRAAADIYEQTGLDFVGIDLLFGEDKPYFCEINVMPGLEGIERTTGVNVAGAVMRTIREDLTGQSEEGR